MKKTAALLLFLLIFQYLHGQEFEFTLFAESNGQSDSVILGFDRTATFQVDTLLGELDISNTPYDSVFEIRAGQVHPGDLDCYGLQDLNQSPNLVFYQSKKNYLPIDCSGWRDFSLGRIIFATVFLKNDDLPITLKWDEQFNDECLKNNIITDWHPYALFDVTCAEQEPILSNLNTENSLMIDRPALNQIVDQFGDTLSLLYVLLGPDATSSLSKNISLTNVNIFPNPADQLITIEIEQALNITATVLLTDLTGRMIWSKTMIDGQSQLTINSSYIPSGVYLIMVQGDNGAVYQSRLTVVH